MVASEPGDPRLDIDRQWMAVRIVAQMGRGVRLKWISSVADRELLDNFQEPKPGKNHPRLYSLAHAIQLHGADLVAQGGVTVAVAMKIGRACVDRFKDRFLGVIRKSLPNGPYLHDHTGFPHHLMVWWIPFGEGKPETRLRYQLLTPEEIADLLCNRHELVKEYFQLADGTRIPANPGIHQGILHVDYLLEKLWANYSEVDEEFNTLALEGRLKPFPKWLEK